MLGAAACVLVAAGASCPSPTVGHPGERLSGEVSFGPREMTLCPDLYCGFIWISALQRTESLFLRNNPRQLMNPKNEKLSEIRFNSDVGYRLQVVTPKALGMVRWKVSD